MFDQEEFGSDSSDDDYVPGEAGEGGSEEESGEEEDVDALLNEAGDDKEVPKTKKRGTSKKKKENAASRKRTGGIKLEDEAEANIAEAEKKEDEEYKKNFEESIQKEHEEKKELQEKKKSDDLWASFLSDVPSSSRPKPAVSSGLGSLATNIKPKPPAIPKPTVGPVTPKPTVTKVNESLPEKTEQKKPEKITITKEFDFAGEIVSVTKEVDAESKEAKQHMKKQVEESEKPAAGPSGPSLKRPGGGLGSVLGKIGKKPKMGTLEKSKIDWNTFKKDEGIDDELQIHNRGKEGYVERQAFLQRTDLRQFEMERQVRMSSKR